MDRYFIRFNSTKQFVQKLYKLIVNDLGQSTLQYHGEQGGWHYSHSFNAHLREFLNSDLTEEVTKVEMNEYITNSKLQ